MRIAVLCTDQGVRIPGEKGASLHLLAITKAFQRIGHQVLLIGVAGHGEPPDRIETFLLPHPGRSTGEAREAAKLAITERFVVEAEPILKEFAPDVIYERLSLFGTAGVRLAELTAACHVLEVNALLAREEAQWRGLHAVSIADEREAQVLAAADVVVAVSDEWAKEIVIATAHTAPLRSSSVYAVSNGFDDEAFTVLPAPRASRRRFGLPRNKRLALFSGSLRPWHGIDVAIGALASAPEDLHLVIAGDGEIRGDLEANARTAGVEGRVIWLGHVPHAEMPSLLAAVDVAVAPYPVLKEFAFSPLKLYEYLGAGVPIVASDVGQVGELLSSVLSARLVAPGDMRALAVALDEVSRDDTYKRAARSARAHALQHHSWVSRAEQITSLIRRTSRQSVGAQ